MSEFDTVSQSIDTILTEFADIQRKMREEMQEKFGVLFKAFFKSFPEVKTIHWLQYTPYFNDGDECVFSVNEVYFTSTPYNAEEIAEENGEDEYEELDRWGEDSGALQGPRYDYKTRSYVPREGVSEELQVAMGKLSNIVHSSEDILLAMFDNHVWVRAHADGFDVQEYDHD